MADPTDAHDAASTGASTSGGAGPNGPTTGPMSGAEIGPGRSTDVDPALHPQTRAIRAGRAGSGTSLAPVLWATSAFVSPTAADARRMATSVGAERFYTRYGNPTVRDFEKAIADLEGAEAARAYASGMGAVTGIILALCSAGDHIVATRQIYAGTQLFLQMTAPRFGIDVTFVDGTEPGAMEAAVRKGKTQLVWAESPANPKLDLVDLDELGAIRGPVTVVDSTFATPLGQQPLAHGVDLVLHSATKGIGGHNDATLGVVAGSSELVDWLWGFAVLHGASPSPYDALNALRGLRTLAVRLRQQTETAQRLAEALEEHSQVAEVRYPGLLSHPQHDLAKRQMITYGGMLTFDVAGGLDAGRTLVESVEVAQLAASLGGPETLVTHPASTTHVGLTPDELAASGIGPGTIRLSCGLEHPDDVVADIIGVLDRLP
jgi:cystathionine beta-lyase/cystathionine gamma-synthase